MSGASMRTMRDAVIDRLTQRMAADDRLFFLSADLGAPALDALRRRYPDRFVNVGIAEQNLVSVAAGLAMEGAVVFAYALAPFLSMRALEQIRNDLALLGQVMPLNVNLLALGAGLSYDLSGPTHHCVEDLAVLWSLPNIAVASPSDPAIAAATAEAQIAAPGAAYIRLDSHPLPPLYSDAPPPVILERGYHELRLGGSVCIAATGFMVHTALAVAEQMRSEGIAVGVIDVLALRPLDSEGLFCALAPYQHVIALSETIRGRGLDALILSLFNSFEAAVPLTAIGLPDTYFFENARRSELHRAAGIDTPSVAAAVRRIARDMGG